MYRLIGKSLSISVTVMMIVSLLIPAGTVFASEPNDVNVDESLLKSFQKNDMQSFIISFHEEADVESVSEQAEADAASAELSETKTNLKKREAVIEALKEQAHTSQENVLAYLKKQEKAGLVEDIKSFHVVNKIAVTGTEDVVDKLRTFKEIKQIDPNEDVSLIPIDEEKENSTLNNDDPIEPNVKQINAPGAWDKGIDGSGVVVANIDSGVDWDHPAIKQKYRGYDSETGDVTHSYNWFDATKDESETPEDGVGHGTHVMGTILGSEKNDKNQIGVAPGATWIAVKAFDRSGKGKDDDLLAAAEWIIAPTDENGNERPDLAPDVVNNSWSSGKENEFYRDIVRAWIAAGIFPTFSAGNVDVGNSGGPGSVEAPANYPESFAVGNVDSNNTVSSTSLRGPSPYDEIKPDIAAPGSSIRSSIPGGKYGFKSGTSMAAPAVTGVVALVKQAAPTMEVDEMKQLLKDTATPLTDDEYSDSPNNGYGHGLINAEEAVKEALDEAGPKVDRLEGYLRYDTAIDVSKEGWDQADTVILARGDEFADALAGVPLAYKKDAPILLTDSKKLYDDTLKEIKRLGASNVIVLGGPIAINKKVITELEKEDLNVRRIAGDLRFETATKIAEEVKEDGSPTVAITDGMDFPDALSIAPYAAKQGIPILLVQSKKLPDVTKKALQDMNTDKTFVIGGPKAISKKVIEKLPNPERLDGSDRFDTNIAIANRFEGQGNFMYVSTGMEFADALTGSVLAAKNNTAVLLVHDRIPQSVSNYITTRKLEYLTILGGPIAVDKDVENKLKQLVK